MSVAIPEASARESGVVTVAVWGFYEELLRENRLFTQRDAGIGEDLLLPFNRLYALGPERGIRLVTLDHVENLASVDVLLFLDFPRWENPLVRRALASDRPKFLVTLESPIVKPDNWNEEHHRLFDKIFTYHDPLVDGSRYFKINYACELPAEVPHDAESRNRLCTIIAGNKDSTSPQGLYRERLAAIRWYEGHHPSDFDLYGKGWDSAAFPSFRGEVASKRAVLRQYRFSLCYENVRDVSGYITEKIFDCFLAGCVPVYRGADNVADHIPIGCFIDRRAFHSYEALHAHLAGMPDSQYVRHREAIAAFLGGAASEPFSIRRFCDTLIQEALATVASRRRPAPPVLATVAGSGGESPADPEWSPRISVCIPTYNRARFLGQAVESALAQDYPHLEIVIADNASTDGTEALCRKFAADPRVRYVRNAKNEGGAANIRSCAHRHASGEYILILSDDDALRDPAYLSKAVGLLRKYRRDRMLLVFSDYVTYSEAKQAFVARSRFAAPEFIRGVDLFERWWSPMGGDPIWIPFLTCLFHRQSAIEANFGDDDIMAGDTMLWWKLCLVGNAGFVDSPAAVYRVHDGNDTSTAPLARYLNNLGMFIVPARLAIEAGHDASWVQRWKLRIAGLFLENAVGPVDVREAIRGSGVVDELMALYRRALSGGLAPEEERRQEDRILAAARVRLTAAAPAPERGPTAATRAAGTRPKVLLVAHDYVPHNYGGVEVYTRNLGRELASRGCRVSVLYPVTDASAAACAIVDDRQEGVSVHRLVAPPGDLLGALAQPEKEAAFGAFLRDHAFDVVHFQHTHDRMPMSLVGVANAARLPVVLTLHDFWFLCPRTHLVAAGERSACSGPEGIEKCARCFAGAPWEALPETVREQYRRFIALRQEKATETLRQVDLLSAPSRFVADTFARHGHDRIEVQPLGIAPVRALPGRRPRPLAFGYVGTIHELKNVLGLVDAFSATHGDARLLLYGHGQASRLEELARAASDPRIAYRGAYAPEDLPAIFSLVDVIVVPSLIESYGFTVREALSAGLPVVAADVGGMRDAVVHMENGLLFDPGAPGELQRALQGIIDDPGLLGRLKGTVPIQTIAQDAAVWDERYATLLRANASARATTGATASPARRSAGVGARPLRVGVLSLDHPDQACARLRLSKPLGALGDEVKLTWGLVHGAGGARIDPEVAHADMFVVQRMFPRAETQGLLQAILATGKPVVYETDDLLVDLPDTNPHQGWVAPAVPFIRDLIGKASAVTVSTDELARALSGSHDRIFVLPNLLDERLWGGLPPVEKPRPAPLVIGYAGTATHLHDLRLVEPALLKIAEKYGEGVTFRFMGCATERIAALPGFSFLQFDPGYDSYARALPCAGIDVGVVPLEDNRFNRCKSSIKWLEYSACGIAGVYSDLPPYRSSVQHGDTGMLVESSTDAWFQALDRLVGDAAARTAMARKAREAVMSRHTLAAGAHRYLEVYREVLSLRGRAA